MINSADAQALPTLHNPSLTPEKRVERYGRSGKMISAGFFSGLVAQNEIDDLLNMLYGSYGERLIVSYKEAS